MFLLEYQHGKYPVFDFKLCKHLVYHYILKCDYDLNILIIHCINLKVSIGVILPCLGISGPSPQVRGLDGGLIPRRFHLLLLANHTISVSTPPMRCFSVANSTTILEPPTLTDSQDAFQHSLDPKARHSKCATPQALIIYTASNGLSSSCCSGWYAMGWIRRAGLGC